MCSQAPLPGPGRGGTRKRRGGETCLFALLMLWFMVVVCKTHVTYVSFVVEFIGSSQLSYHHCLNYVSWMALFV